MATAARAFQRTEPSNGSPLMTTDMDTLFMMSGIALMVFGAGLVLANPVMRRMLGDLNLGNLAQTALPDLQRYMRLRDM